MASIGSANRGRIIIGDLNIDEVSVGSSNQYREDPQYCASRAPSSAPIKMIYRGVTYHIDPNAPKPPSTAPRSYQLIYRGCTYQVTRDAAGAVTAITPATKHSKR